MSTQPMFIVTFIVLSLSSMTTALYCFNHYSCCSGWAASGNCFSHSFMSTNCRASCGFCRPSYKLDEAGECHDYVSSCRWGKCDGSGRYWMEENCRKWCGKCEHPRHSGCPEYPPFVDCGENEEFKRSCDTCKHFCTDRGLSKHPFCWDVIAWRPCLFSCACKEGYIRDSRDGKCILPSQCQPITTTTPKPTCGPLQELIQTCGACGKACHAKVDEKTGIVAEKYLSPTGCWDAPEMYAGKPCPFKCLCKRGYVKDYSESGSVCIRPRECEL